MFRPIFSNYKIVINDDEEHFLLLSDSNVQYQGQCRLISNIKDTSKTALVNQSYFDLIDFITSIDESKLYSFYQQLMKAYSSISAIQIYIWSSDREMWCKLFDCNKINDIVLLESDLTEDKIREQFYGNTIELTLRIFYS